uniref:Cadherin domain-containing protein n=1 Tax=Esox lucius TaxID=8010 RepID=A0A3P8ZAN0_ESOLU
MNWAGFLQIVLVMVHLSPISCHGSVRISIPEEQDSGICVGSISSTFPPPYQLLTEDYIRMDKKTGDVFTTNHRLDRESLCPDQPQGEDCIIPQRTIVFVGLEETAVQLVVVVEDINDNTPVFDNTDIHKSVPENVAVGTSFLLDNQAVDRDTGRNAQLRYHLEGAAGFFTVKKDESEGTAILFLVVQKPLDRETLDLHEMTLVATDQGAVPLTATAALSVEVTDVDDNCPEFSPGSPQRVNITAGSRRGTAVAQVRATDPDLGFNAAITYALSPRVSDRAKELFTLNSQTGLISLRVDLHVDTASGGGEEVVLKVLASDPRGHCTPADTQVTASLLVTQQPSLKIRFLAEHRNQTIMLQENKPPTVLAILELPGDTSRFIGSSSLSIEGEEPFSLSPQNGKYLLSTSKPLDYEMKSEYHVSVVTCSGVGEPKTPGHFREVIRVLVVDVNDNAPQFLQSHYHLDVEENNPPGSSLLTVTASDADGQQNSRVTYRLVPTSHNEAAAIFRIDSVTGQLTASASLDREQRDVYTLSVLARDSGSPPLESTAMVTIRVLDQNDNAPVFLTPHFFFFIPEDVPPLAQVGKVGVLDADAGPNGEVEVRVLNGSVGPFIVDSAQGTLRCTAGLDRERQDRYELLLLATDNGRPSPLTSVARVTVFLEDVNDNRPKVVLPSSNLSCLPVSLATATGTMLTKIYAVDEDSGLNSEITYTVAAQEPPGSTSHHGGRSPFKLDARTGNVTLAQRLMESDKHGCHIYIFAIKKECSHSFLIF